MIVNGIVDLIKLWYRVTSDPLYVTGFVCGACVLLGAQAILRKRRLALEREAEEEEDEWDSDYEDEYVSDEEYEGIPDTEEMKLMLIIRNDLGMGKGKAAAQCAHAAVQAYRQASVQAKSILKVWQQHGQPKVVVKVDTEEELLNLAEESRSQGLVTSLICDAGRTQIEPGSKTVLGIGPAPKSELDRLTKHLKLY